VYANDAGNGVESIDHDSNSGECGANGGSWAPGYVNENWAYFNGNTQMFQVASLNDNGGNITANYTMFSAGATTQWNDDESSCTSGCSGFSQTDAQWLSNQLVGNSTTGGYLHFLSFRDEPLSGGGLNNLFSAMQKRRGLRPLRKRPGRFQLLHSFGCWLRYTITVRKTGAGHREGGLNENEICEYCPVDTSCLHGISGIV
jgi:hypothetical protein